MTNETDKPTPQPCCPSCDVQGFDKIVSGPSHEKSKNGAPWFYISFCGDCGHVYGVFTKHTFGPPGGPQLVVRERGS